MLLELHVKNFALIDEADLNFRDNLNILTGETGSGKSILIGSVTCALGGRVSKEIVRDGAEYASVELVFESDSREAAEILAKYELPDDAGQFIISRRIQNTGRSITKINGEPCSQSAVKELAECLLDIHGQHEHQSLLYKKNHLIMLDDFAKQAEKEVSEPLRNAYKTFVECRKALEAEESDPSQRQRETDLLEFECREIRAAELKPGEKAELSAKYRVLSNSRAILEGVSNCYRNLSESQGSAADNVSYALKALSRVSELDDRLRGFETELSDIENLLNDLNRELSDYLSDTEGSEEELKEVSDRLDLIHHLESKYGDGEENILDYLAKSEEKLAKYADYDEYIAGLELKKNAAERQLADLSEELSKIRKEEAEKLEQEISDALHELNFEQTRFKIEVSDSGTYTANGRDDVEFLISMNPGEPLMPLAKIASGGELSRIMLGIKSVLADRDSIGTLIFDEIDTGISGRTAQKVSERLAVIAKKHQVLCITHLPQIASMADSHYLIEKSTDGVRTKTTVTELSESESRDEIARLLGGARITESVISNASEMKALAKEVKENLKKKD